MLTYFMDTVIIQIFYSITLVTNNQSKSYLTVEQFHATILFIKINPLNMHANLYKQQNHTS